MICVKSLDWKQCDVVAYISQKTLIIKYYQFRFCDLVFKRKYKTHARYKKGPPIWNWSYHLKGCLTEGKRWYKKPNEQTIFFLQLYLPNGPSGASHLTRNRRAMRRVTAYERVIIKHHLINRTEFTPANTVFYYYKHLFIIIYYYQFIKTRLLKL